MAGSDNAASPGSPRAMAEAISSPPQPNSPTAQQQEAATLTRQTLHVDTSSSRGAGGVQQGERAAGVDNPASEPNDPAGGNEEEDEEFRYNAIGQASGDASVRPRGKYLMPSSPVSSGPSALTVGVLSLRSDWARMTSLSPTTSTGSSKSPQSSKSPYSKWDPRHEEYARTTSAAAASGSSEVSPSLETPPAPDWSSASSPVMVSVPSWPI